MRRLAALGVATLASVGCGGMANTTSATLPRCNAAATMTALYDGSTSGPVGGLFLWNEHVLFSSSLGLFSVPLAGGSLVPIASGATGLGIVGNTLYYSATVSGPPDAQGRQMTTIALFSTEFSGIGIGGVDVGSGTLVLDHFTAGAVASDGTALYVSGNGLGSVLKLAPSGSTPMTMTLGETLDVRALAVDAAYLYAAVQDLATAQGAIVRVPKGGGSVARLVTLAGLPDSLAVDEHALYWIEWPPAGTFGNSHIARSDLSGRNESALVNDGTSSQFALALGPAHVYFLGDVLARVPKAGGPKETVATSVSEAGLLNVSGGDVVWVEHFNRALSSGDPTSIEALCAGGTPPAAQSP